MGCSKEGKVSSSLWAVLRRRRCACGALQAGDCSADDSAGGFGGDTKAFADLAEALALPVEQSETGFHGVAGVFVERAEQFVEQVAVDHRHHGVLGSAVSVGDQVAERLVAVVPDGLVERDGGG